MQHAASDRQRLTIAIPLVVCWLAGTVYAFWWFQARDLRGFDAGTGVEAASFDGRQLATKLQTLVTDPDATRQTLMVHFWNPECACNRFNNPHVRNIIEQYQAQGIRFITVVRTQADSDDRQVLARAEQLFDVPAVPASKLNLDIGSLPGATPAAAVLGIEGQLAYFGPYSDSAFCATNGRSFVENALDEVLAGIKSKTKNTLAFGCFCQWNPGTNSQSI